MGTDLRICPTYKSIILMLTFYTEVLSSDIAQIGTKRTMFKVQRDKKLEHRSPLDSDEPIAFTDDTAMARSVAASLIEREGCDIKDMAYRFVEEFLCEPHRGYGADVGTVFHALDEAGYGNVHGPASRQFDGSGSYGNGGGMRIAPAALYGYRMNEDSLNHMVTDITKITHTHPDAVHGATLQCVAVHSVLNLPDTAPQSLDVADWLDGLRATMDKREHGEGYDVNADKPEASPGGSVKDEEPPQGRPTKRMKKAHRTYCSKLRMIKDYVTSCEDPSLKEVEQEIGTGILALEACPAAVYSFARCTRSVPSIPKDNPFERTIIHAISLGGDTDTIATMAGAIAGACYGLEAIPPSWQASCEGTETALKSGQELFDLVESKHKQATSE